MKIQPTSAPDIERSDDKSSALMLGLLLGFAAAQLLLMVWNYGWTS